MTYHLSEIFKRVMLKISENAKTVLYKRNYLKRDASGKVVETPEQMFYRVANAIAAASGSFGEDVASDARNFYRMMRNFEFLPNSPTLMHAGRNSVNQLSACFVLPIEDSLESIFRTLHDAALVLRTGGGVGYAFSRLRPRGSLIMTTGGVASGPVSFMDLFNHMAQVINEGSSRRAAMMGVLRVNHPDIEEFVVSKVNGDRLNNFNISVGITNAFVKALKQNKTYALLDPQSKEIVRRVSAQRIFNKICENAWKVADPGLVFLDRMNEACPIRHLGEIEAVNVCGEQPLLPYQSCNLGSINLAKFVRNQVKSSSSSGLARGRDAQGAARVDWDRLEQVTRLAVKFLDNVIDVCKYPLAEIDEMSKKTRKIGLGVMGFADLLFKLGVAYNSNEGVGLGKKLAKFIDKVARGKSVELGEKRGSFSAFSGSRLEKQGFPAMRNSTITTIAPTGTISILASCSSGIEPIFALSFTRSNILDIGKTELVEFNGQFRRELVELIKNRKKYGQILEEVARTGSCQQVEEIPDELKRIFVTSHDIDWKWHIKMQAAWQRHIDSAVSKTINLKENATIDDVKQAYLMAYDTGCMGITIYRDKSKKQQVLNLGRAPFLKTNREGDGEKRKKQHKHSYVVFNGEEGVCPYCRTPMAFQGGCASCPSCSYSYCSAG